LEVAKEMLRRQDGTELQEGGRGMRQMRFAMFLLGVWVVAVYAEQHVVWDGDITYGLSTGRSLQQFTAPLNWKDGMLHRRLEVKSKPTDFSTGIQLCVWSGGETCSSCDPAFTETGVYYTASNPGGWWKKAGDLSGWNSHGDRAYVIKRSSCDSWLSTQVASYCIGPSAAPHLPISVHVTEIYNSPGEDFDCPSDWTDAPWPECGGTSALGRAAHNDLGEAIQVNRLSGDRILVNVPHATTIALYTTGGQRLAVANAGKNGVQLNNASRAPSVVLLRAATDEGVVATKLLLAR